MSGDYRQLPPDLPAPEDDGAADHLLGAMVLAIEPGIYWEGGGGLRVEDNWLITDGEPEKLCRFPDGIVRT